MSDSILTSVKGVVGIDEADVSFDPDILMYTNSALTTLQQLGVGPETGIQISDSDDLWTILLLTPTMLGMVKSYISLKVRLSFDPPQNATVLGSMTSQVQEYEQRLITQQEIIEKEEEIL